MGISIWLPHVVGAQLCRLSPVDARTVALKPCSHEEITRHYSRYCAVAFCYMHKCELCYMCPGHDLKLHPCTPSEIRSNRVYIGPMCGIWLGIGKGANVTISK